METFKDLKVWQHNQECIVRCAELADRFTSATPSRIIFEQLFRAICSVGANIAEGYGSYEGKEYPRYCKISLRSAIEADHWLTTLSKIIDDGNLQTDVEQITRLNTESIKMLMGLIRSIEKRRANNDL